MPTKRKASKNPEASTPVNTPSNPTQMVSMSDAKPGFKKNCSLILVLHGRFVQCIPDIVSLFTTHLVQLRVVTLYLQRYYEFSVHLYDANVSYPTIFEGEDDVVLKSSVLGIPREYPLSSLYDILNLPKEGLS